MSRQLVFLLILCCIFASASGYTINTNLHRLAKRAPEEHRRLYVGDKTKEEYKNDLSWIAYFPMEKLQGARYEWLPG